MPNEGLLGPPGGRGSGDKRTLAGSCGISSNLSCPTSCPLSNPAPRPTFYPIFCPVSCPNLCPSPFSAVHPAPCLALCFVPYPVLCPAPHLAPSPALSLGPCPAICPALWPAPCPSCVLPYVSSHKGSCSLLDSVPWEQPPLPPAGHLCLRSPARAPGPPVGAGGAPPAPTPAARSSGQVAKQVNSIRAWGWRGARPHCRAAGAVKS